MKNIIAAIVAILSFYTPTLGQTTVIGNASPLATNLSKGNFKVDSTVILSKYAAAASDTAVICTLPSGSVIKVSKTAFATTGGGAGVDTLAYLRKSDTISLVPGIKQFKDSVAAVRSYVNGMGIDTVLSKGNQTTKTLTFKSGSAYNQQSYSNTIMSNGTQVGSFNPYGIDWTPNGGSPTNVLQWRIPTVTGGTKVVNFQNDSGTVALLSDTVSGSGIVPRLVTQAGQNTANALNIKYADTNTFVVSLVKARTLYHLKGGDTYGMTDTFGSKDAQNCVYMANGLAGLTMSGTDQSSNFTSNTETIATYKTSGQNAIVTIGVGRAVAIGSNTPFISFNTTGTPSLSADPYYYGTGYANNILNPLYIWSGSSNTAVIFTGPPLLSSGSCLRFTLPRGGGSTSTYAPTSGLTSLITLCQTGASSRGAFAPTSGTASMMAIVDSAIINQTGGANGITGFLSDDGVTLTAAADWRSIRLTKNSGRAISQEGTAINTLAGNTIIGATADNGDKLQVTGNVNLTTAGNKIKIATGSNASLGTATLVGGTVTVSTTAVATGSKIFVSRNTVGGTTGNLSTPDASIVNGTSFVINSTSGSETSTINWWIIN